MPLSCCSAARFTAPLISSFVVARLATNLKSMTETFGVGTRIATPSSLPASSGSASPVEVLVYLVERGLVIGVGMHRGHETLVNADGVIEHLRDRRQTVGGARGGGDDFVVRRELVVIDAIDHGEIDAISGRRHDDAFGAGGKMRGGLVLRGEDARALECNIDAEVLPRQRRRLLDGGHLDQAVADADRVTLDRHLAGKAAVHGIEAQQMRIGLDRGEIVDADDLDIGTPRFGDGPQHVPADAAEPVDAYTN